MNVLSWVLLLLASVATQQVRTGVVSGTVQALDGAAAAGVRVAVVAAADQSGIETSVIADENGRYRIEGIPPGRYWIIAGALLSPTYYPGKATPEEALLVTITALSPVENVDFRMLTLNGRITGKVTNLPNPAPPALRGSLKASLRAVDSTDGPVRRVQPPIQTPLRADGTFEFRGIASGEYTLTLVPGAGNVSVRVTVGTRDINNLIFRAPMYLTGSVEMDDGTALPASYRYQGNILTGMGLYVKASGSEPPLRAAIWADGSFHHDLPRGDDFTVSVEGLPFGVYIKSMTVGQRDLMTSSLPRGDGSVPSPMKIVLTRVRPDREPAGFTVRGRVIGEIGEGFELNFVSNASRSVRSAWFRLPQDREFEIRNVPPGTYTAQILDSSGRTMSRPPNVTTVTVTDRDVRNVEVPVPSRQ
jgi:hypothetical protein